MMVKWRIFGRTLFHSACCARFLRSKKEDSSDAIRSENTRLHRDVRVWLCFRSSEGTGRAPVQVGEPLRFAFVIPPEINAVLEEVFVALDVPVAHLLVDQIEC